MCVINKNMLYVIYVDYKKICYMSYIMFIKKYIYVLCYMSYVFINVYYCPVGPGPGAVVSHRAGWQGSL